MEHLVLGEEVTIASGPDMRMQEPLKAASNFSLFCEFAETHPRCNPY